KAVTVFATDIIGNGITPRPRTGNEARDAKIKEAFKIFVDQADADGQLDFYGLQTLAVRLMVERGEVLARRRWRAPWNKLEIPVQIQLLEGDFLDNRRSGFTLENGNFLLQGIEFDQIGRRVAYWLYREHPGNSFIQSINAVFQSDRVSADDVAHLYEKQRTQARGVTWFSPVVRRLRD